ncbi:MotA/TolQ/ExbB proton channel family protein [Ammoniphilus sp. CFH 90114]|uniref:MotA/TolQ/ExbB proton channel family protein n=1 Tax=Ammoniphilus sp. CFH 90114 TaxID=2493665 RepID=UPI00100E33E7|nr:MotA/TolQ/ExbB proton channel family protein [Ammoniphilus sp. CFH 90114]RXT08152.1 motility protein A [Ammoniphilus sp. CFH 90114]
MQKKDIATISGLAAGVVILVASILVAGGLAGATGFIDIPSVLIVFGGTICSMLISFQLDGMKKMFPIMKKVFTSRQYNLSKLVDDFVRLASTARREGLLALEDQLEEMQDDFIKKGITLAVDGTEQDALRGILDAEIMALEDRHGRGRAMFDKAGELAPAWGMIGTLIGLVLMLRNLSDPASLGPSMAVAMITTFYGSVLANFIFIPIANKLAQNTEEEVFVKQVMIEGIIGITSGINPKVLEEKLTSYLPPEARKKPEEVKGAEEE